MGVFQIELPDNLTVSDFELKMWIASRLFEEGRLSSGQAAEIIGYPKELFWSFWENMILFFWGIPLKN